MAAKKTAPTKLTGNISWVFEDDTLRLPTKSGVLRSKDEMVLDCDHNGWQYVISLKRTEGSRFEGRFFAQLGQQTGMVIVSCTLYSNDSGYLLLGKWLEDGNESNWWAELSAGAPQKEAKPR
jgi:hypothetical protein